MSDDVTHSVTQIQVRAPTPTTRLNLVDQQQSDVGYYEEGKLIIVPINFYSNN